MFVCLMAHKALMIVDLLNASIRYTQTHFPDSPYVFADEIDPSSRHTAGQLPEKNIICFPISCVLI